MKRWILFVLAAHVCALAPSLCEVFGQEGPRGMRRQLGGPLPKSLLQKPGLSRKTSSFLYTPSILSSGVTEDWVARYDNPGFSRDTAVDIAVGASGNIYVTGYRTTMAGESNFVTVKYNSAGDELWAVTLPQNSGTPVGIGLDDLENVYVGGRSFLAVKYNSDGGEQWVGQYDDGTGSNPSARAFALLGNAVYLTGTMTAFSDSFSTAHQNFLTVGFDPDGNQAWAAVYDGFEARQDRPSAIAATQDGIFVTGLSDGRSPVVDFAATVAYEPATGAEHWVARRVLDDVSALNSNAIASDGLSVYVALADSFAVKYSGSTGAELWSRGRCCSARAITLDAVGNVYLTGANFVTSKLGPSGDEQWSTAILREGDAYDIAESSGFIYVTGRGRDIGAATEYDMVTIQYDADTGTEFWESRYNGIGQDDGYDAGQAVAVASSGIYVAGTSEGTLGDFDYATVRYGGLDGTEVWAVRHNAPGNSGDFLRASVVDADGNVYVTGVTRTIGRYSDYLTVKLNSAGIRQWSATYSGLGSGDNSANDIALDGDGNIYVTGVSEGTGSPAHTDAVTIKYSNDGAELWVARFDGQDRGDDGGNAVIADDAGNVYATGYSYSTTAQREYLTIKYGASGQQQWAAFYNNPVSADLADEAVDIAVDDSGNVCVTGTSNSEATSEDYATVKYNAMGVQQWAARYDFSLLVGPNMFINRDRAAAIAVDAAGNVYVTGESQARHAARDFDYATIKYNASGERLWTGRYDASNLDAGITADDHAVDLAVDAQGSVYVTGNSLQTGDLAGGVSTGYDYVTIKYNSFGTQQWASKYNGPNNGRDTPKAVIVDDLCNVYVTGGGFNHLVDVIVKEDLVTIYDFATIKYSCAGEQLWAAEYNDALNGNDVAMGIGLDGSGNVYVAGSSDSLLEYLGDEVLDLHVYSDFVAIRYSQDASSVSMCPIVVAPLPRVFLNVGDPPYVRDLNDDPVVFSDPENNPLTYSTSSSDSSVAVGSIAGSVLTVAPVDSGLATIFITAEDGQGGMALDTLGVRVSGHVTGVDGDRSKGPVKEYVLYQSYPNPFNPETSIAYDIPEGGEVTLRVYNVVGREVRELVSAFQPAGSYTVTWDGRDEGGLMVPSGIYFCRMETASYVKTRKISLLR